MPIIYKEFALESRAKTFCFQDEKQSIG